MATLSFRLPASRLPDRPLRQASWSRGPAAVNAAPAPSRNVLTVITDVLELQPPTDSTAIRVPVLPSADSRIDAVAGDGAASGWFDSTWDLQQGLDVCEGLPCDLPLGDWLRMYLAA